MADEESEPLSRLNAPHRSHTQPGRQLAISQVSSATPSSTFMGFHRAQEAAPSTLSAVVFLGTPSPIHLHGFQKTQVVLRPS